MNWKNPYMGNWVFGWALVVAMSILAFFTLFALLLYSGPR